MIPEDPAPNRIVTFSDGNFGSGICLSRFKDPITGIYYSLRGVDDQNSTRSFIQYAKQQILLIRGLSEAQVAGLLKDIFESTKSGSAVEEQRECLMYWRGLSQVELQEKLEKLDGLSRGDQNGPVPESCAVAIVDSGFIMDHPLLQGCVDMDNSVDFIGEGLEDRNGHGTFVALRATQGGKLRLLNVKMIGGDGSGSERSFLKALEWLTNYRICHPSEQLIVNLSVGVYSKKRVLWECRGDCRICSAAMKLANAGATLFIAAGNTAGKTACPATAAVIRKHPNMIAIAAAFYPDSGIGTYTSPSTTELKFEPIVDSRSQDAVKGLITRIGANPGETELHLALLNLLETGKFPVSGESTYAELAASHPDIAEVHHFFGRTLLGDGKVRAAEEQFREAVRLKPDFSEAHNFLAIALIKQRKAKDAEAEFLKAIQMNPDNPEFRFNIGVFYSDHGRIAEAEKAYREAIRRNPDDAESHYNLGNLLGGRHMDAEAVKEYREAIRCKPDHASARFNLGRILCRQGSLEAAEKEFRASLAIRPGSAPAHCDLGALFERQGKAREAEEEYRESIRCDPDFAEAHHNLGGILMDRHMYREAAGEYQEAVRCKPDYSSALKNLQLAISLLGVGGVAPQSKD
jgi:tetratricopeptide (TPR) repeat protein